MKPTFKLLGWLLAFALLGYLSYPLIHSFLQAENTAKQEQKSSEPSAPQEVDEGKDDEDLPQEENVAETGEDGEWVDSEDDAAWADDDSSSENSLISAAEKDADSYMTHDEPPVQQSYVLDDVPDDPEQQGVPAVYDSARRNAVVRAAKKLADQYAKEAKKRETRKNVNGYTNEEFNGAMWKQPEQIQKVLVERVLAKLGNCDDAAFYAFLADDANRLDLARLQMLRLAGLENIRTIASSRIGSSMLTALCSDLDWMTGLLYSGPTGEMSHTLMNMMSIFARYSDDLNAPVTRRIATTTASEFAREHWSDKDMMDRFRYYFESYRDHKLNVIFDTLGYWDTRFVTGCVRTESWGSPRSLAWQRDNVRLPVEGYLGACTQLQYRLRNVAGDSVFSQDYLAPILKYTNNTTAWAHREIGGVCGACSHYGAFGALAAGIPASPMGEPGHCAYTVRVGDEWKMSYSIYWQHGLHKTFWNEHDWDFLILTQRLYTDQYNTLVADQLTALGDLLAARKKPKAALACYQNAVLAQPLDWPSWLRYTGYLKEKAADKPEKWVEVHSMINDGMAKEFHDAAATLLRKYVYPVMLPAVQDKKLLTKLFDGFFDNCKTAGSNRWDISPLLDAQIAAFPGEKEERMYLKESLRSLMGRPDYAGPVLIWGLDYVARHSQNEEEGSKRSEALADELLSAMSRARTGKKQADDTWAALGEAIQACAENKDRRTFQAIGRLAYLKFKKKFPRKQIRFRAFPGRVVSATGLLDTATTIDPNNMQHCCLHWAVLQRFGGSIPGKFEGKAGMTLQLEHNSKLNGVVVVFDQPVDAQHEFYFETSMDGQAWTSCPARVQVDGQMLRCDMRKLGVSTRHLRLLREGNFKYEPKLTGFYVYGTPIKEKK